MDPLSASISTVLMNLAAFLQERRGRAEAQTQATIQEYTEWLRRREHTEALAMLESILGSGSKGSLNYTITRAAAKIVQSLPEPVEDNTNNPA